MFMTFILFRLLSLYPHLFSRAYISFKHAEDILLFRDRFDGYVFIDNKGIWTFSKLFLILLTVLASNIDTQWVRI